jgi:hypothetical protein
MSIAHVHETNGVTERFNQTLIASVRVLLFDSGLPLSMWAEAITYAVFTKNRMPHASLSGKCPLEVITGEKPDLGHLQPEYQFP